MSRVLPKCWAEKFFQILKYVAATRVRWWWKRRWFEIDLEKILPEGPMMAVTAICHDEGAGWDKKLGQEIERKRILVLPWPRGTSPKTLSRIFSSLPSSLEANVMLTFLHTKSLPSLGSRGSANLLVGTLAPSGGTGEAPSSISAFSDAIFFERTIWTCSVKVYVTARSMLSCAVPVLYSLLDK